MISGDWTIFNSDLVGSEHNCSKPIDTANISDRWSSISFGVVAAVCILQVSQRLLHFQLALDAYRDHF